MPIAAVPPALADLPAKLAGLSPADRVRLSSLLAGQQGEDAGNVPNGS